jgi:hypothetical protein
MCDCVAGLAHDREGGRVTTTSRALDVVRAFFGQRATGGERFGASFVGAQPPRCGRRLVDRAPDERVPKAEAAGHVCFTNEVELQQFVYGNERCRFCGRCRGGREFWVERVTGHRGAAKNETRAA